MPKLEEISIGPLLDVLRPTYRSMDLRVVAVQINQQWRLVAGILVASRADPADVRRLHADLLRRSRPPESDRFRILFEASSVQQRLSPLLDEIDAGKIVIDGLTLDLGSDAERAWVPIRTQSMQGNNWLSHKPESDLFRRYSYSLRTKDHAQDLLANTVGDPSNIGLVGWSDLNLWLGQVPYFQLQQPTQADLELVFPVYVALRDAPSLRVGEVVVTLVAHGTLQPKLTAREWVRQDSGDRMPICYGRQ